MSGGPVWAVGRIVAVVAEHHPSEGTGRLTPRRIDRAYDQLSGSDLAGLVETLGLARAASDLRDVIRLSEGSWCGRRTWRRSPTSPPISSSAATTSWRGGPSSALALTRTPGGRPARGRARAPWRPGSSLTPRPVLTSCRSLLRVVSLGRPTATHSSTP